MHAERWDLDGGMAQPSHPMREHDICGLLQRHRDWRVNIAEPLRSVIFASSSTGAQLAPIPCDSKPGQPYKPVFLSLGRAIQAHRATGRNGADSRSFAIDLHGVRVRVQHVQDATFHVRVCGELLPMEKLGIPGELTNTLLGEGLNEGGLVVVCGGYGSGKTTTVNAIVRERVNRLGGYALVLGNPIEYEYRGFHGTQDRPGYIEQVDLSGLNLVDEIKASMRNFPSGATSILAYPELIGPTGVGEMLRAANRGNLVFADMHALNIEGAILNLVAMGEIDGERYARELLGNSLKLIVHQRSHINPPGKRLNVAIRHLSVDKALRAAIGNTSMPLAQIFAGSLAMKGASTALG
jgi:Tfp pilus assembly pilus retraction ATPase PilT